MRVAVVACVGSLFFAMVSSAFAQSAVTAIKIRTDPENAVVQPLESLVVQVMAYGEVPGEDGYSTTVRIQRDGARVQITDPDGGWLSKPFRFQGAEREPFYEGERAGLGAILLRRSTRQFVLQDSVLYTAPRSPGTYEVEAKLDGKTARLTIRVEANAPSRLKPELTFAAEIHPADPYRPLAEHYAPLVAQETWFQPKSDYLARFDFDGDWRGDNNWDSAETGSSQAYVYYGVMETETHWFLVYDLFHPRDYSDKCVAGTCHENDSEGLILTILKDGSAYGRLQTMETLAHNNIYSYRADRRVRNKTHNIDGEIELYEGSHPVIFIESGGHGVYGSLDHHSRYSLRSGGFQIGTGVTYVYHGRAEQPVYANARNVGYDLLPIYEQWWLPAHDGRGLRDQAFDAFYVYQPYGTRPPAKYPRLAGAFLGRKNGSNKAKPFWGWHDNRTQKRKVVATGQWGLDPAYAVSENLAMPAPFSLDYVFNPYLGIGDPSQPTPDQLSQPLISSRTGASTAHLAELRVPQSRNYNPTSKKGQFDIRLHVDATVEMLIQGDVVRYEVLGGRTPTDDGSEYSQPIPQATFRRFELDQRDGRGKITLLEKPSPGNAFTVKLRIDDPRAGDDRYHARLQWEWDKLTPIQAPPMPPPQPTTSRAATAPEPGDPRREMEAILPGVALFSSDNRPDRYNQDSDGIFEFRGRVDGTVIFRVQGDQVFAEALNGGPAKVERLSFSQPVPGATLRKIEVEKRDGRGEVTLLEWPWEGNSFTAVVRVSDPRGGDDRYHFRMKWER